MKKALMIAIGLVWTLVIDSIFMRLEVSEAVTISGLCLTEPEFTDFNSMTLDQIREFLTKQGGFLKGRAPGANPPDFTFDDVDGGPTDAAQEIYNAAQTNKINPRVLIATIEKESGAVRRFKTRPNDDILNLLTGFGSGSPTAREQIKKMAEQLQRDFDRLSQCNSTLGGWQVDVVRSSGNTHIPPRVTDEPETDAFGETLAVQPQDKGVTALYQYTPWAGLALGGGHRSFDPNKPERPLVGGNGSFCRLWSQFGFARPAGPIALALSPQTPTLTCAPETSRCVSINVSGGTPGPDGYSWAPPTKGVLTPPTGVDKQNIQLKPPVNAGGFPGEIAYKLISQSTRFNTDIQACQNIGFFSRTYNCDDSPQQPSGQCTGNSDSDAQSGPVVCSEPGQLACPGFATCSDNCGEVESKGSVLNKRTQSMIDAGCKPCRPEMQGATVTVTDSAGDMASATLTVK